MIGGNALISSSHCLFSYLVTGWTAEYDFESGLWYYVDHNLTPPASTWQDPRMNTFITPPTTYPPFPEINSQRDADWVASQFGALEAHRQHTEGLRGPVAVEIDRERNERKELKEAIQAIQRASTTANEAITKHDSEGLQRAQEAMIKARGVLDRLSHNSHLRSATVPPALQGYQGVTRGFELDPAYLRPRTYYTDNAPLSSFPNGMVDSTTFRGRFMAKMSKPRIPGNVYMPTAYPLPPGVKYTASSTPTPYAIPEFCFTWDMLLRSRRDPTSRLR